MFRLLLKPSNHAFFGRSRRVVRSNAVRNIWMGIGRIYKTTAFLCLMFRQEGSASAFGACRLQAQFHSLTYRYHPTRAGAIEWLRSSTKSQAGGFHDPKKQSGTFLECRQVADPGPEKPAVINNSGPRQQVDARMAAAPPASKEVRARFAREKPFCLDWIESIA